MLYGFVKIVAKIAFHFYCRSISINDKTMLQAKGPLLIAANHPNSFLDAIILCTLFDKPVYSLARGDAFKNKLLASILFSLKMLPVYRVSEGVENLDENYKTFDRCKEIFRQNGIVLIFSEGRCVNEWHLRPLKKGTARLALSSWQDDIPLKILPLAINYNSFKKFGKNIHLSLGFFITKNEVPISDSYGRNVAAFKGLLQQQLAPYVYELDEKDIQKRKEIFTVPISILKQAILLLPAIAGWVIHAPLYFAVKQYVLRKNSSSDHYDSLMVSILFLTYPLYLLTITTFVLVATSNWYATLLLLIIPFTAWAQLQIKSQ